MNMSYNTVKSLQVKNLLSLSCHSKIYSPSVWLSLSLHLNFPLCWSHVHIYLLFYVAFNSQGHIATGSLQVEETSAYCTVNHRASASNYQLSNMKSPARDSNRQPQRLEARTLTTTPPVTCTQFFCIYFTQ